MRMKEGRSFYSKKKDVKDLGALWKTWVVRCYLGTGMFHRNVPLGSTG